jgi:ABC-type Fe3+/spermidine/putrescine transport system ATPase subunit
MTAVTIDSVKVKFGDFEALRGVSLTIESGSFVTLLGPSGCGKTTLLKTIAGFISPSAGYIYFDQADVSQRAPEKRDTAMCFQSYALFPHLSVADNLLFGLKQRKASQAEQRRVLSEIAGQVSLETQLDKLPTELSGGQQQRVALGRALAIRPGIILFDEPLSNLDAKLRDTVRQEIRQLQEKHCFTAIYVTHDQAEALAMSDVIVVMNGGEIQQIGSPESIYYTPLNRFVADFIGAANILRAEVLEAVADRCYRIRTEFGEMQVISDRPPVASQTYICWRPEAMQLHPQGHSGATADNLLSLRIQTKTFLGNLTEFWLVSQVSDEKICLQCLGSRPESVGDWVNVSIAPSALLFLMEEA